MLQTFYMVYILKSRPHTTDIFNYLEFFNEGALITLAYVMLIFSGMTPINDLIANKVAYVVAEWSGISIAILIAVVNFYVMFRMTYDKMRVKCKKKKQKAVEEKVKSTKEESIPYKNVEEQVENILLS